MKYKEKYAELKHAMKLLNTLHVFDQFDISNLFYLLDGQTKAIAVMSNYVMGDSTGIQLHLGNKSINYLYDSFTSTSGMVLNGVYADMLTVSIVKRQDLLSEDIAYLKKHKVRLHATFNIIPLEFNEGYDYTYMSMKKMDAVIAHIYYLLSLIKNEKEDILKSFEEGKMVLAAFDTTNNVYDVRYTDEMLLGSMPRFKKRNQAFVEEYENSTYVDDVCYVSRYFLPTKNENGCYDSILFAYYTKKDTHFSQRISCKPNQIIDYICGFLDEMFKKEGLPTKMIFNHRGLITTMFKTLNALHIDLEFSRETVDIDQYFLELLAIEVEKEKEGEKKQEMALVS